MCSSRARCRRRTSRSRSIRRWWKASAAIRLPRERIITILQGLGFVVEDHGSTLQVVPPTWRHDVDGPADLVEEVVRIHGLTDVPSVAMARPSAVAKPVLSGKQRRTRTARRALAARGFNECVTFSFIARDQARLFGGGDDARQLSNPIASDLDALRPSVLPSLLAAASRNAARGFANLAAVRDRRGLRQRHAGGAEDRGRRHPHRQCRNATGRRPATKRGLFAVKADLLAALEAITGGPMSAPITQGAPGWYHPGRSGTIAMGPKVIAQFGELHPKVLAAFDLKGPGRRLRDFPGRHSRSQSQGQGAAAVPPSPYQAIERDFAFVVDAQVAAGEIVKAVKLADRNLIDTVSVFDRL